MPSNFFLYFKSVYINEVQVKRNIVPRNLWFIFRNTFPNKFCFISKLHMQWYTIEHTKIPNLNRDIGNYVDDVTPSRNHRIRHS